MHSQCNGVLKLEDHSLQSATKNYYAKYSFTLIVSRGQTVFTSLPAKAHGLATGDYRKSGS